jgi:hypothetical protein
VVPKPKLRSTSTASLFKKFNQEHDDHGRFGGPGGSHDPTGRPVGRPPGAGAPPSAGKLVAQAGIGTAGSVVGGYAAGKAGALAGGALGAAIGGPFAPWTAAGGAIAGNILGSIAGDYVASKIGNSLLGLKERGDGHPVGTGEMIGSLAALAPEAAAVIPGAREAGGLIGAGAQLFAPEATSLASHAASGAVDLAGITAGQAVDRAAGKTAGSAAGKAVRKDLFEQPKSYDGTFSSMATAAIPHLVGPRAWKTVSSTPFGDYIRQKVKETATRMDDAAEMSGADLTPAKPKDVQAAGQVAGQQQAEEQARQQQQVQMDQQAQQQTMQVQDKTAGNQHKRDMEMNAATHGQKMEFAAAKHKQDMARMKVKAKTAPPPALPFKKAFALPFHSPNDVVSREAQQSGGHANVDFLRRMQESERRSRQIQLLRVFHGPKAENLAQRPGEDEKAYRDRITQVMAQSVRATGDPGRNIFSGGAAGQRPVYHVRKKRTVAKQVAPNANQEGFNLQIEIAKGLNTERRMEQGLVTGWASIIEKDGQIITDHQGDRITPEELTAAAHDFIANSRQGGVLHDEFGKNIGHIVESVVMTRELQKALDIDLKKAGWLITYKVEDPRVKAMVKAGVLKSFSIGGKGHREAVDVDD